MIKNFEWKIAKRYIGYNNKFISLVSYLATIGIALGVMTLIIVMSVMNGYEVELRITFNGMRIFIRTC